MISGSCQCPPKNNVAMLLLEIQFVKSAFCAKNLTLQKKAHNSPRAPIPFAHGLTQTRETRRIWSADMSLRDVEPRVACRVPRRFGRRAGITTQRSWATCWSSSYARTGRDGRDAAKRRRPTVVVWTPCGVATCELWA